MSLPQILLLIGVVIVAGLGAYAAYLVRKVILHKRLIREQQAQAAEQANEQFEAQRQNLINDIRFLSNSVLQQQCEITEGVLRLQYCISRFDTDLWEVESLKGLRQHYEQTCDMPILDAYKALAKKERMRLDKTRWDIENENKDAVEQCLRWLVDTDLQNIEFGGK